MPQNVEGIRNMSIRENIEDAPRKEDEFSKKKRDMVVVVKLKN